MLIGGAAASEGARACGLSGVRELGQASGRERDWGVWAVRGSEGRREWAAGLGWLGFGFEPSWGFYFILLFYF